jgi:hypothetical protein
MRSFKTPVHSHWHTLVENFSTSSLDFYNLVEAGVRKREIPNLLISRVEYYESGVLSATRIYRRIQRKKLVYDICAAPFGNGFFFSAWVTEPKKSYKAWGLLAVLLLLAVVYSLLDRYGMRGCFLAFALSLLALLLAIWATRKGWFLSEDVILATPYLGYLYEYLFDPETYYKEDTRIMFQEMVHAAVLEAVDEVLQAKGLRALAPESRKLTVRPLVK